MARVGAFPLPDDPFLVTLSGGPPRWTDIFGVDRPLEVEVGAGKGVFLARLAASQPGTNLIGVEIRAKRVAKIVRRLRADSCDNARVLFGDARRLFREAFAPGSVRRIYLNFPDPWPKRRHAKRRIFRGDFPAWAHRVLAPEGEWIACTDVAAYAREMLEAVERTGLFDNIAGPGRLAARPEGYPASIHEEKFRAWGREIHYLRWRKRASALPHGGGGLADPQGG